MRQVGENNQRIEQVEAGYQVIIEAGSTSVGTFAVMAIIPAIDLDQFNGNAQIHYGIHQVKHDKTDVFRQIVVKNI